MPFGWSLYNQLLLCGVTTLQVTGLFPDDFVESPSLFKRGKFYYLTYGSCCCGCQEGGGQVVFRANAVEGPYVVAACLLDPIVLEV
jgi:hypothetical protein